MLSKVHSSFIGLRNQTGRNEPDHPLSGGPHPLSPHIRRQLEHPAAHQLTRPTRPTNPASRPAHLCGRATPPHARGSAALYTFPPKSPRCRRNRAHLSGTVHTRVELCTPDTSQLAPPSHSHGCTHPTPEPKPHSHSRPHIRAHRQFCTAVRAPSLSPQCSRPAGSSGPGARP